MDKIMVGVTTRNKAGYLAMSLRHNLLLAGREFIPYDVVWVAIDDAANDDGETWRVLSSMHPAISSIRNPEQRGITGTKNMLFEMAAGCKYLVALDDDLLLGYHWLVELIEIADTLDSIGLLAPYVCNDRNMQNKLDQLELGGGAVPDAIEVDGFGAACVVIPQGVFKKYKYPVKPLYGYEDAAFHGMVQREFPLRVAPGVTAVHIPDIVMLDVAAEKEKLLARHRLVTGSDAGFEESWKRQYSRTLNRHIK